jgi:hypothetical protein
MKLSSANFGLAIPIAGARNLNRRIDAADGKEEKTFDLTKSVDGRDEIGSLGAL